MEAISDLINLQNKTAIVTGAAMGIGRAAAERLHQAGANIVIADPSPQRQEVVDRLNEERGGSAWAVGCDVSIEEEVDDMVSETSACFGRVDILVNNAGIFPRANFLDMNSDFFDLVISVNLRGLYLTSRYVAQNMIAQGNGGRIINITSIDALHPSMVGLAAYDASKHGAWG